MNVGRDLAAEPGTPRRYRAIERGQEVRHGKDSDQRYPPSQPREGHRLRGPLPRRRRPPAVRTFETKDEARAFQTAVLADLREGTYVAPSAGAVPFRVVAEQWFAAQLQLKRRTQIP